MKNETFLQDLSNLAERQRVFRARQKLNKQGYISHITQRAAGREPLFLEDADYLTMLGLLKEVSESFDLHFYALCLMDNHVHLLLEPRQENLSQAMHSIFFRYAMRFNRKYSRRGHIFGGAYRQAVCLDSSYFLAASVYIHLNPVRAGLVEKASDYRWSSCSLYVTDQQTVSFVNPSPVLSLLDADPDIARKYYAILIHQGLEAQPDNALEQETTIERFLKNLAAMFPWLFKRIADTNQDSTHQENDVLDLPELETMIQEVQAQKPRSPETVKAKRFLIEQLIARGFVKREIAEKLGISPKTVYNILNKPTPS
jgi:putative transposase